MASGLGQSNAGDEAAEPAADDRCGTIGPAPVADGVARTGLADVSHEQLLGTLNRSGRGRVDRTERLEGVRVSSHGDR
jgi:hypothetical protein